MLLIKPARLDDAFFYKNSVAHVEGFPNTFLVGCHFYQQAIYDKAREKFTKIVDS